MRRGIVLGWLLGMLTFGAGLLVSANWYEYRIANNEAERGALVNERGFHIVPDQTWPSYLRRPRLSLQR